MATGARQSVLYRCVQEPLKTSVAEYRDGRDDERPVRDYVEREFRATYLESSPAVLRGGEMRRLWASDRLFLQRRAVCPSRNIRRMGCDGSAYRRSRRTHAVPRAALGGGGAQARTAMPRVGSTLQLEAVALIHRFGSTLNSILRLLPCLLPDNYSASSKKSFWSAFWNSAL
jgi:hypothetical protein